MNYGTSGAGPKTFDVLSGLRYYLDCATALFSLPTLGWRSGELLFGGLGGRLEGAMTATPWVEVRWAVLDSRRRARAYTSSIDVTAFSQEELLVEMALRETKKSAIRQGLRISKPAALRAKDLICAFRVLYWAFLVIKR